MECDPAPPWPGAGSPRTSPKATLRRVQRATLPVRRKRRTATLKAAERRAGGRRRLRGVAGDPR
jgi:hypothetical protein